MTRIRILLTSTILRLRLLRKLNHATDLRIHKEQDMLFIKHIYFGEPQEIYGGFKKHLRYLEDLSPIGESSKPNICVISCYLLINHSF